MASRTSSDRASSDREVSRNYRMLFRLARFAMPYRWQIAGATFALLIAAGTTLALGAGLRLLIDQGFGTSGDTSLLDRAVLILFGVSVLLACSTFGRFYLVSWVGERVVADIRKAVFDHIIGLSPGFFEITRTGEVVSRLTTDTTLLQVVVGSSVSIALRNTLLIVGGMVMLFITSPKLTLLVLAVVPLVVAPIVVFGRKVRRLSRINQDKVAEVSAEASEALYGIRTVQAFAHEPHDRARFSERTEEAFSSALLRIRWRAILTGIVILLVFGSISVVLWVGGADVVHGRLSAGQLSAFVFYAVIVAGALGAVSEVIGDLQRAAGAMERIGELLTTAPTVVAPANPKKLPQPSRGAIEFEHVTFRYPSRPTVAALDDFTLSVKPGERVAIVGPSGAGKTTVMQLVLRFYDPDSGVIRFDGIDLRELDPAALRAAIGTVPQDPTIFGASARDNIRYARPDASEADVLAAAKAAHALDFIERLPQGLDTFLGERGVRLSGGQRQRIAIARAILRNPALLLLDEATSALDAESERIVQEALDEVMRDRTTLVIAHRLATVLKADRIVVMDKGRIEAIGNHAELMRQGGLYAYLAALQFDQPRLDHG
ncbi:MAG TPA: ABC transporter transmembrane domain-containing protein [Sphingomicrobium sp.]|nr:ABC transporter transmembrane domain-containing protein [Sphingomicrobium sp.]